jgi:ADP-ribosylglycohydrolase
MDEQVLRIKFLMTGAISGVYLGFNAIPTKWRDKLENLDYIVELAERLCNI